MSCFGWGRSPLQRGLGSGRTGIAATRAFDTSGQRTRTAAEVPDAAPRTTDKHPGWASLSRADRFAVAAALEAVTGAGWSDVLGCGVWFGTSTAAMAEGELFLRGFETGDPKTVHLRWLASHQLNGPGDAVARDLGIRGPVLSQSSACASGALAIGAALEAVRTGRVERALAGGSDSLCVLTYSGFNSLRSVDPEPCRPFRADRAGLSLGEGAGVLALEAWDAALERGAPILAELLGAGSSCDAHNMTAPRPDGGGAVVAIRQALADADLDPEDIAFVSAHGTGTPLNDASEATALGTVFGERLASIPLTATKGAVGHLLGASGAIEAVAVVDDLIAGAVAPTAGASEADPDLGVDLVLGDRRPIPPGAVALSTSFGFGGANAALVLGDARDREGRA